MAAIARKSAGVGVTITQPHGSAASLPPGVIYGTNAPPMLTLSRYLPTYANLFGAALLILTMAALRTALVVPARAGDSHGPA